MFQQPELRHDEVAFYKHIVTERHGLGEPVDDSEYTRTSLA